MILKAPEQTGHQEMANMVQRLRDGDDGIKNTIIRGHIRMVFALAQRVSVGYPRLSEDITAAGYLSLVESVERAKTVLVDNDISPYINACTVGAMLDVIRESTVVHIPHNNDGIIKDYCFESLEDASHKASDDSIVSDEYCFKEFCEAHNLTDFERYICKGRCAGESYAEIAKKQNCSTQYIGQIIGKVRAKVKRRQHRLVTA